MEAIALLKFWDGSKEIQPAPASGASSILRDLRDAPAWTKQAMPNLGFVLCMANAAWQERSLRSISSRTFSRWSMEQEKLSRYSVEWRTE